MTLAGSLTKLVIALVVLGWGLRAGWQEAGNRPFGEKVPILVTVLLATFPPVGFVLYVKHWEEKPPLSWVCLVQALFGVVAIVLFYYVNRYTPPLPAW